MDHPLTVVQEYVKLLFDGTAIWRLDATNLIMRKHAVRKQKVSLHGGTVHVTLNDRKACTCPEFKYDRCIHLQIAELVNIHSLPPGTGVVSEKPFVCAVKKSTWGLVTTEGGGLHCVSCKKFRGRKTCDHVDDVKALNTAPLPKEKATVTENSNSHEEKDAEVSETQELDESETESGIFSHKRIAFFPMSDESRTLTTSQAAGLQKYPSTLSPPKSVCKHGNILEPYLVGNAIILSLGAAITQTLEDGQPRTISIYKVTNSFCKCTNHYDGFEENLININDCFLISYSTATFLKLSVLEGSTFHSLHNVMYDTLKMATHFTLPCSKIHFKKIIRMGVKGFMSLSQPYEYQKKVVLTCPSPDCHTIVFDGTAVGPKTEMIDESEQYEPKLVENNGQIRVVGSRINRRIVTDSKTRAFLCTVMSIFRQ